MISKSMSNQKIVEELGEFGFMHKEKIKEDKYSSYHHVISEKNYMAKIYPKNQIFKNRLLREQVNREYKIGDLIKKNFSYLLAFHDFFYTKSFAVFIYEYCRSGTLEFLMGTSSLLDDDEKKIIIKDIYQGLEELRFLGVIHKNLDSSCVYLSKFSLKIGGFEYCEEIDHKVMDPAKYRFFLDNTPDYDSVPPELLFNQVPTLKTPLYSLGVLIYQLFHDGKFPLNEKNLKELKHRYMNKDYKISFSDSVYNIKGKTNIKKMLNGLLEVNVKERMSFVKLRGFIGLLHQDIKSNEEEMRYTFLNRRKHIEKAISMKSSKLKTKRKIRGTKSSKILPSFLKKPSLSRTIPDFAKLKKSLSRYNESFMNQSIRIINTFKSPDPDSAIESKEKYPIPAKFKFLKPNEREGKKRLSMWRNRKSQKFRKTKMFQKSKITGEPVKLTRNQTFYSKKIPVYTTNLLENTEHSFDGEKTVNSCGYKTFFSSGFPNMMRTLKDGVSLRRLRSSKSMPRRKKFRIREKNKVII